MKYYIKLNIKFKKSVAKNSLLLIFYDSEQNSNDAT